MLSRILLIAPLVLLTYISPLAANTYMFATAANATAGNLPVDIQVSIDVKSPTFMVISVMNLEANPTSDIQNINALTFDFATSLSGLGTITFTSSAVPVTLAKSTGVTTFGPSGDTGWATAATSAGTSLTLFSLCDLANATVGCGTAKNGSAWPAGTLVGPPGPGGTYSTSGGGSLENGSHNPLLFEEAEFYVTITNSVFNPAATTPPITNMNAGFGTSSTTSGLIPYVGYEVDVIGTPEPAPVMLIACGAVLIGISKLRRRVR